MALNRRSFLFGAAAATVTLAAPAIVKAESLMKIVVPKIVVPKVPEINTGGWNLQGTVTGRISCSVPTFQQLPKRMSPEAQKVSRFIKEFTREMYRLPTGDWVENEQAFLEKQILFGERYSSMRFIESDIFGADRIVFSSRDWK